MLPQLVMLPKRVQVQVVLVQQTCSNQRTLHVPENQMAEIVMLQIPVTTTGVVSTTICLQLQSAVLPRALVMLRKHALVLVEHAQTTSSKSPEHPVLVAIMVAFATGLIPVMETVRALITTCLRIQSVARQLMPVTRMKNVLAAVVLAQLMCSNQWIPHAQELQTMDRAMLQLINVMEMVSVSTNLNLLTKFVVLPHRSAM